MRKKETEGRRQERKKGNEKIEKKRLKITLRPSGLPPGWKHILLASIFPRQERHSLTSTATYHFRQIPYTYTVHAMHKKKKSQPLKRLSVQLWLRSARLVVQFTTLLFLTAVRRTSLSSTHGGWRPQKQNQAKQKSCGSGRRWAR